VAGFSRSDTTLLHLSLVQVPLAAGELVAGLFLQVGERPVVVIVVLLDDLERPVAGALAWIHARRPAVIPVVGVTKVQHIADAAASLKVQLTTDDLETLDRAYFGRKPQ